jgi:succinyl-CoA synthetase beta subunit
VRLHEFQAKSLFGQHGITVPEGRVAAGAQEASEIALELGCRVVVKAQVLVGGRGLAGGILTADTPEEAGVHAETILGSRIRGEKPEGVLVEERAEIDREIYLGITVDGVAGRPALMVSASGGVRIEEVARQRPGAVASAHADPDAGLTQGKALDLVASAGVKPAEEAANVLCRLHEVFSEAEATIAEINPLAITVDGRAMALDAVVEVDDAALFRHPDLQEMAAGRAGDPRAQAAKSVGMTFVGMDGDIGLICSGAGLGMATMDLIARRGKPANFLETGGGITRELMAEAMRIVLGQPALKGVLINIYGGINPIHEGAVGVADVMAEGVDIPVVAKALGNYQEETWATLEAAGVTVVRSVATESAVDEVLRRAYA